MHKRFEMLIHQFSDVGVHDFLDFAETDVHKRPPLRPEILDEMLLHGKWTVAWKFSRSSSERRLAKRMQNS